MDKNENFSMAFISFKQSVTYTKQVISYNGINFLVDFGSGMGLWLGMSVASLSQDLFDVATHLMSKFKN